MVLACSSRLNTIISIKNSVIFKWINDYNIIDNHLKKNILKYINCICFFNYYRNITM